MKKIILSIIITILLSLGLTASSLAANLNDIQMVESITISFVASSKTHTYQLTNVADVVGLYYTGEYPYSFFYFPGATIVSSVEVGTGFSTDELHIMHVDEDGTVYESNYFYGNLEAGTLYNLDEVFAKSTNPGGGGILGPGAFTPIEGLYRGEISGSIFDFEVTDGSTTFAPAAENVNPTASTVIVNGNVTAFEAYNIGGYNYFKLRDLAYALNGSSKQFAVGWDEDANAISLISGEAYEPVGGEMAEGDETSKIANPTTSRVFLNGQELNLTAYNIADNNFFRLRDLMSALDIGVTWDDSTSTVGIDTTISYME